MASLTHVCMWSGNGWKRIEAEEAAKLHPGGTVSAHSGLFMCELCGQFVILTDGNARIRYFKHSAYEKSKDCPERTFGTGYLMTYNPREHDLPIRITNISSSSFGFELGIIRAPIDLLDNDFCLEIKPKGVFDTSYVYAKERLNCNGTTYLSIGEKPFKKYTLSFRNGNDKLREFWPMEIDGIAPDGALFEKISGKKLAYDADVEIGKEYYLLKQGHVRKGLHSDIQIQEIAQKRFGWESWTLYIVSASVFCEDAARFYLDFHCRLTNQPISLQLVWPIFVEGDYVVKHNQDRMYMLVDGNIANVKTYPYAKVRQLDSPLSQPKLYEVFCSDRQQLISAGRAQALQYTYFWQKALNRVGICPEISVTDLSGVQVSPGEVNALPRNKTLRFKSAFDAELTVFNQSYVIAKYKLLAHKYFDLGDLAYGLSVEVAVGLDVIWKIDIKRRRSLDSNDEVEILKQIINTTGTTIPAPHSLQNMLIEMNRYPQICRWIRKCIKCGTINEQSYRRLQNVYRSMRKSTRGDAL